MYKQIIYPKSHHCPRGQEPLVDYLRDVEYLTRIYSDNSEPTQLTVKAKTEQSKSPELKKLDKLSKMSKLDSTALRYLEKQIPLVDVLIEGVANLRKIFGQNGIFSFDLLDEHGKEKLFVKIHTKSSADDALQKLDLFDNAWWFNQSKAARQHLEFVLEFE